MGWGTGAHIVVIAIMATSSAAVKVRSTWMRNRLLPKLSLGDALAGQSLCASGKRVPVNINGYTTPAVRDVGAASLRLQFPKELDVRSGGYLLGIRAEGHLAYLPAIAGVPWDEGLDRYGASRRGLAELVIMGRPLDEDAYPGQYVTFFPEDVLTELYPKQKQAEVVVIGRLTDFFLGLNAGRWLLIRMTQLCNASSRHLASAPNRDSSFDALLSGSGIAFDASEGPQAPPEDKSYLFHHHALSGNGGISGQRIVKT